MGEPSSEPIAQMPVDAWREFRSVVLLLNNQQMRVREAESSLNEARLTERAINNERLRLWNYLRQVCGLDPDGDYTIDESGRVFDGTALNDDAS